MARLIRHCHNHRQCITKEGNPVSFEPTAEAKQQYIAQKLQQFHAERFAHEFNLTLATDPAINDEQAAEQSRAALAQLDAAIANAQAQLDALVES